MLLFIGVLYFFLLNANILSLHLVLFEVSELFSSFGLPVKQRTCSVGRRLKKNSVFFYGDLTS